MRKNEIIFYKLLLKLVKENNNKNKHPNLRTSENNIH